MRRLMTGIIVFLIWVSQALAEEQAPKLDTGDTAWMLISTALVILMTIPGLALFYGGLSKQRSVLNTMAMSFTAFALISVLWVLYGYAFSFGNDIKGIIGSPDKLLLSGVGVKSLTGTMPEFIFSTFQLTFAAITVALASGAFVERLKFSAWMLFCILWLTFVYVPVAHWVWGNGFLFKLGALDFAGGTVVHINSGIAALIGALFLGKRQDTSLLPHNLPMVATGAALLWFGWFGFNAGSALAANGLAGVAFINTNTAAAVAALAWLFTEWVISKKPTLLGLCSGAVAGLVAITPAAGFVDLKGSLIIGALAGIIPYFAVVYLKPKLGYDDALDVFGIHGVAGTIGAILTGIFANPEINEAGKGLLYGNYQQFWVQLLSITITVFYDAIITAAIFLTLKVIIGLRVDTEEERNGLDESQHGEKAYNFRI